MTLELFFDIFCDLTVYLAFFAMGLAFAMAYHRRIKSYIGKVGVNRHQNR